MKNVFQITLIILLALTGTAFAQDVVVAAPEASFDEFFGLLFKSIGELKGASTLVTVAVVAQLIMKLIQTQLGELLGKYKLITVSLLTVVLGVVGLMTTTGLTLVAALLHSSTLATAQVFIHQLYKQFFKKGE